MDAYILSPKSLEDISALGKGMFIYLFEGQNLKKQGYIISMGRYKLRIRNELLKCEVINLMELTADSSIIIPKTENNIKILKQTELKDLIVSLDFDAQSS